MKFPYKIIDLSHNIDSEIPLWPGSLPLKKEIMVDYPNGCCVLAYSFMAGTGTHIDAPSHFIQNGKDISSFIAQDLIGPINVINICEKVKNNNDYALSPEDINLWESKNGKIEENSIVIAYTGWYERWPNAKLYQNLDESGTMHFPGFSPDSAKILLQRNILGLGIDTFSPDPGIMKDFPVHHLVLGKNKFLIENLTNLALVPTTGAYLIALPLNIKGATESPARVIALIPQS